MPEYAIEHLDEMRAMVTDWRIEEPGIKRLNEVGTPNWYEGAEHTLDAYAGDGIIISK
jgi:hypothetical protein